MHLMIKKNLHTQIDMATLKLNRPSGAAPVKILYCTVLYCTVLYSRNCMQCVLYSRNCVQRVLYSRNCVQ